MTTSAAGLQQHMHDLVHFSAGLIALADAVPDRMTMAQTVFFLFAGLADLRGTPATYTEIREEIGDTIGKSLHTTYRALIEEGRNRGGKREIGVGWLMRETDPKDNRRKYLRLTKAGRRVLQEVGIALQRN